jgi:hypothetical protein
MLAFLEICIKIGSQVNVLERKKLKSRSFFVRIDYLTSLINMFLLHQARYICYMYAMLIGQNSISCYSMNKIQLADLQLFV